MNKIVRFLLIISLTILFILLSPALVSSITPPINRSPLASQPTRLDQQARSHYASGQYTEAAELFRQTAQAYAATGDRTQQALSLSNLSLTYQQIGQWQAAQEAIAQSLSVLPPTSTQRVQVLDIQAALYFSLGQAEPALNTWQQVTELYKQQENTEQILLSYIHQSQALQQLGLSRQAIALLYQALDLSPQADRSIVQALPTTATTATALRILGDLLRTNGDQSAQIFLEQSLAIAQQQQLPDAIALAQLSLGNLTYNPQSPTTALTYYQQAANNSSVRVEAQVNQLNLLVAAKQTTDIPQLLPQIQQQLDRLPINHTTINLRINLAQSLLNSSLIPTQLSAQIPAQILAQAIQQAQTLNDARALSYALGSLGGMYEQTQQWTEAKALTQQALQTAQQINAEEISYRWQWQLGRILKAIGQPKEAIAAYQGAVGAIKSLRADLATASPDVQFVFRDAVDPIHRQLVELLVQTGQPGDLKTARDVIESLQLVELDNFFREACLTADPTQVDQVDSTAAVIYPILLEDQLAVIVSLPNADQSRSLRYYKTTIARTQLEKLATNIREDLDQSNTLSLILPGLQQLYDWILRPAETDLVGSKAKTLVFVLDGVLRNLPMSALHDGQQYVIEKYSVAVTPGLQLLAPRSLTPGKIQALVVGLDAARPPKFSALPFVANEIQTIESTIPSQVLFNQQFTQSAFQTVLEKSPFPIVHLATHGQFSSRPEGTFVLAWDRQIPAAQLSSSLQTAELKQPLELLVLSACETATGDDRAALGLAGVAVRSGARSTIATLWQINDQVSSQLMTRFYAELANPQERLSKAEALRRAQVAILRDPNYQFPYYWAAYVFLGNWL
jgi:CHAT domain-containing protein